MEEVDEVVVEQTVALPESPDDEVTLGVHPLVVEGDVMVLRVTMTPRFASVSDREVINLFEVMGEALFRPQLIDGENLKEYSVIGGPVPWNSGELELETVNGSPMVAWAYYAAPVDDLEAIDVRISDGWPAFTDVPISQ